MSLAVPTNLKFNVTAAGTTFDIRPNERGKFNYMTLKVPNFTNAPTVTIQIIDEDGDLFWDMTKVQSNGAAVTAQANNTGPTIYQFDWDIMIHRGMKIRCLLSGVAGGTGGVVKCYIAVEANK